MANTVLNKALTSFIFFSFFIQTEQDNPCPYPCYPPPTGPGGGSIGGGGGSGTVTQTPPASYSPPSQTGIYPPPTGNLPYYTQPPPYDGNSVYGQPPPDPILPYFPFYYRKPPHKTDDQASGTAVRPGKSMFIITVATNLVVFVILVISSLGDY